MISMRHTQYCSIHLLFFLAFIHGGKQFADGIRGSHQHQIKFLPGFEGPLPFELETGYVGVDEGENVQLFYYFVKSSSDPRNDPLVLWLSGGPGCSSLSGFMFEIGPMAFEEKYDGKLPRLRLNPHSWTEVASILFVDLPVGAGFSYSRTPEAASSTGLQSCRQAHQFLLKWLVDHPEFMSKPFYVGGDSYTGITVPVIVQMISDGIEMGIKPQINLKGYLLGNGLTFLEEKNYVIPYARGMGLISNELYRSLKRNCKGKYRNVNSSNVLCLKDVHAFDQLMEGLNLEHILQSDCRGRPNVLGERRFLDEEQRDNEPLSMAKCHPDRSPLWANDPSVRETLHIRKGTRDKWMRCNPNLPYTDSFWNSIPYHANLSTRGYRSLIYSGDHDMLVPFLSTEAWIKSLNYPITDDWRKWRVQNQIAGYTKSYANNMTFATVKGGGHTAPGDCPLECATMFKRWISYEPL